MVRPFDREKRQASKASQELASTLEYYREASELTKKEFAAKLGISAQYLHTLLDGTGNPSLESLEDMAIKLNLEFSPLFRAPLGPRPPRPGRRRAVVEADAPLQRASSSRCVRSYAGFWVTKLSGGAGCWALEDLGPVP